ncbi:MAG: zf-TFIIB domain-containing protein [Deltaproteobacteria bacterium]|nr:zf-TFIIB domain-containing protein [Deltaproteobacteria bacterium]
MRCPRCREHDLDDATVHRCHRCDGTWLDEHALGERLAAMQHPEPPGPLVWQAVRRAPRPCAACAQPMETAALFGVHVDRCGAGHGVWFDEGELAAVLVKCHERSACAAPRPGERPGERPVERIAGAAAFFSIVRG